jgi:predicted ABC-type ATPase
VSTPVLHLLAGSNGAGKSSFVADVLAPRLHLRFVNADEIAKERWPGEEMVHAREASQAAATERAQLLTGRASFITETVFSHPSEVELVRDAQARGYQVSLHVILIPVEVAVHRVAHRVRRGGHLVPEEKIRSRYERLWPLVAEACRRADAATIYDNSTARTPFRRIARLEHGALVGDPALPAWAPPALGSLVAGD